MYLWTCHIDIFVVASQSEVSALFVDFVTFLVVDFKRYFCKFFALVSLYYLHNGRTVPASIMVLAVDHIPRFEGHPPLEILRLGVVGG